MIARRASNSDWRFLQPIAHNARRQIANRKRFADELDDESAARCPECRGPVYIVTDKCPACGYWLSEADRHAMWSGSSRPSWIKWAAILILLALLIPLILAALSAF